MTAASGRRNLVGRAERALGSRLEGLLDSRPAADAVIGAFRAQRAAHRAAERIGLDRLLSGARREVGRNASRARNGLKHLAGAEWAPIWPTPSEVVWSEGKTQLRYYPGAGAARLGPPVVAVGGMIGRAYIFDLVEGNSVVARMLEAGFSPFVLDWGEPDADDAQNTLETYLDERLPRAIDAALTRTGAREVSVLGYCMGGTLTLLGLAANPDLPVRNLITLAAPVDFNHHGELVAAVRERRLDPASVLDDTGNVPPGLLYAFFMLRKPTADLIRYLNLWQNLHSDEYMRGYQALDRCFRDQVPLPGATFLQIAEQWLTENAFVTGRLRLGGRPVSLGGLTMPTLVVLAKRDELVPEPASLPLVDLLTGTDPELVRLDAGHASLTTGRTAATTTLPRIFEWLAEHSDVVA